MFRDLVLSKIEELILPILKEEGLALWDILLTHDQGRQILRVMIEKEGGVTLDDCLRFSHAIEDLLEVKEVIAKRYDLEVSSPGLDRPLRTAEHFKKYINAVIRVETKFPLDGRRNYKGILIGIENRDMLVMKVDQLEFRIPVHEVLKANVEYVTHRAVE